MPSSVNAMALCVGIVIITYATENLFKYLNLY